jgi:hypothetical protein
MPRVHNSCFPLLLASCCVGAMELVCEMVRRVRCYSTLPLISYPEDVEEWTWSQPYPADCIARL